MTLAQLLKELRQHQVVLRLEQDKLRCELPAQGIPAELRAALVAQKEELKAYIADMVGQASPATAIAPRPAGQDKVPLSFAQRRLWLLDQIEGSSAHTNMAYALTLRGHTEYAAINYAFSHIVERHQSLRTVFLLDEEGQPYQKIQPAPAITVNVEDLSALDNGARQLAIAQSVNAEAVRAFDLTKDLLLATRLIKMAANEHLLLVTMHHIASDGWSMAILVREFSALYTAYVQQQTSRVLLPLLDIHYADYAYWQHHWLAREVLPNQLGYWKKHLANLPSVHSLPLDFPRPKVQSLQGKKYCSRIDAATQQALNELCASQGATLFMGLQATFALLLARYSNSQDIVMGSLIANREQPQVAALIGCFFNALVLRNNLANNPSFIALLSQSKSMLLDAYAHQQVPFEQIVELLEPERNLSYSPLFQVLLIMQNTEISKLHLPQLDIELVAHERDQVAYDLRLEIIEDEQELLLNWEYRTDLFKPDTIARLASHFQVLLGAVLREPEKNVFSLDINTAQEQHQLLVEWNNTSTSFAAEQCIHQLIEAQTAKTPSAIALVCADQQLSYAELNARANQLAHYLITEKQVVPDALVGICMDRSIDMMVAILAVLKSGGAYVPLDPSYPSARLSYMLDDAGLTSLITQQHLRDLVPGELAWCIDAMDIQQQLAQQPITNIDTRQLGLGANHLAYVIYTSGSTGNPKGVQVERKGLRNLINWYLHQYQFNQADAFYIASSIAFDLTQKNLFAPLVVGGRLVLSGKNYFDPSVILSEFSQHQISVINCAPSVFYPLVDESAAHQYHSLTSLRYLLLGGEPINANALDPWLQHPGCHARVINMYGPTEATDITTQNIHGVAGNGAHIGSPIANVSAYVLNDSHALAALYVPGELCIGGAGVARGYLHRPELTAEKFIANPFYIEGQSNSSKCLYKTGDLVRWLPNGSLEFLGRIDHQVKIRGLRIELGEIEAALCALGMVKDAIVMAKQTANGDTRLVAYLTIKGLDGQSTGECAQESDGNTQAIADELIRQHLSAILPDYMLPSAIVILDEFPLTPSGKVDRKALPEPQECKQASNYAAPQTPTQVMLCQIWQELLGLEQVGINDNFFRLGGHSLLAIKAITKVNQLLGTNFSLRLFFNDSTILGISNLIDAMQLNQENLHNLLAEETLEEGFL